DGGRYDGAGGYAHDGLHVRVVAVPGAQLSRTQEELVDLQVKLLSADGQSAQVLGCLADVGEPLEAIRFRLSSGASILRAGTCLQEQPVDGGLQQEWAFKGGEAAARERWLFLQRGRRHLLLRCVASAPTAEAAATAFAAPAAQHWFEAVRNALRID